MPRKPIDIDEKLKDLRSILEKYNGIPSQTVDRKAYANVKYYAKNYSDNPKVKSLLEEFGVVIGDKKGSSFEESLNSFKTQLEQLGKLPSIKENQSLYTGLRYFFTKYSDRPEVEKLKYIYAHSSCYPLPDSKEKRPTYHPLAIYIGCVPDYTKWKQESAFEYILYIYLI